MPPILAAPGLAHTVPEQLAATGILLFHRPIARGARAWDADRPAQSAPGAGR
jgi:hypothetical protein